MARQKGHVKYVGTLGEVRHFKIKGNTGYYAGLKGGPTAEQVKTAPGFVRTRENMSEFAACAMAGKSVRIALSALMKQMTDSQFTGRLTAIMKKINIEDGSEARGQRAVLVSQQPHHGCFLGRSPTHSTRLFHHLAHEEKEQRRGDSCG